MTARRKKAGRGTTRRHGPVRRADLIGEAFELWIGASRLLATLQGADGIASRGKPAEAAKKRRVRGGIA